jgi:adenosylcobinamide-phosphate synthase
MPIQLSYFSDIASPDRLVVAILAVMLAVVFGLLIGPIAGNANPVFWKIMDSLCGKIARRTYKTERSESALAFRGMIFFSLYLIVGAGVGIAAAGLNYQYRAGGFMEPLLLLPVLSAGAGWSALLKLYRALGKSGGHSLTKGSYYPIAVSTRSNLNTTDDYGIVRLGVDYIARLFDKGMIAPLFWYLIGGLPLAYVYAAVAAARWGLAKDGFAKGIGTKALGSEKFFGVVPGVIAALYLVVAAAITPTARFFRSVPVLFGGGEIKTRTPYAEGGLPVTIASSTLKVTLGGPVQDLDGSVLPKAWVGPDGATARLDRNHLRRALYFSVMAHIVLIADLLGCLMAWKLLG